MAFEEDYDDVMAKNSSPQRSSGRSCAAQKPIKICPVCFHTMKPLLDPKIDPQVEYRYICLDCGNVVK